MLILSVITYFLEVDYIALRIIGCLCFVGLSVCFLIAFPEKLQEALYGKNNSHFDVTDFQTGAFKSTPNARAKALTSGLRTVLWRRIRLNGVTM